MSRRPARCTEADIKRMGCVYFIRAPKSAAIKIGFSKSPRERFYNLNTGSPEHLEYIGSIAQYQGFETSLHKKFAHLRIKGEWFKDCDELNNHIEDLAEEYDW